MMIDGGTVRYM